MPPDYSTMDLREGPIPAGVRGPPLPPYPRRPDGQRRLGRGMGQLPRAPLHPVGDHLPVLANSGRPRSRAASVLSGSFNRERKSSLTPRPSRLRIRVGQLRSMKFLGGGYNFRSRGGADYISGHAVFLMTGGSTAGARRGRRPHRAGGPGSRTGRQAEPEEGLLHHRIRGVAVDRQAVPFPDRPHLITVISDDPLSCSNQRNRGRISPGRPGQRREDDQTRCGEDQADPERSRLVRIDEGVLARRHGCRPHDPIGPVDRLALAISPRNIPTRSKALSSFRSRGSAPSRDDRHPGVGGRGSPRGRRMHCLPLIQSLAKPSHHRLHRTICDPIVQLARIVALIE